MSDIRDISEWMRKIKTAVWDGLSKSSKDIMNVWAVTIVSRMKTGQGYPSTKPIAIAKGRLARAIQGVSDSSDDGIVDDSAIVYERTIRVPYADISERGGEVPVSTRMKAFFLWKYSQTKEKKWKYMAFAKTLKHKPFEYVLDSFRDMSVSKITPAIMRHVESEVKKIQGLEVIIGKRG